MASPLHKKQITKYLKSHKTSINKDDINDRSQTSAKSNKASVQIPNRLEDKNRAAQGPKHYVAQSPVPKHNASQSPGPKHNASEPPGPKQNAMQSPGTKHNAMPSPGTKNSAAYIKRTKQFPAVNTTKNSIKSLNNLPDEILLQIFQYLGPTDLLLACTISKRWLTLTADNVLWLPIYERYVANNKKTGSSNGDKCVNASTQFKEPGYWKHQCMQRCGQSRSKKAIAMLKKLSPYTGLPKLTTQALESLGTKWILLLKDSTGVEHTMWHSDAFHHQMSLSVRWYGLEWPPLSRITQLSLYAANPIFSSSDKNKQGPCRRSLLLSCKFTWNKWLESLKPIGGDSMCHFYLLADTLLIAVFKEVLNRPLATWEYIHATKVFYKTA
ncbi:unnamed protein product [Owenia fusiformis]|uniref:F-box domain-containing protein n=1 Tax=Owenia fusiformis TaxID=6347 RepID=A0A8S4NFX0_OWEFU|nr:unnamed protein product [Owenia fusiformis]